jgi:hypothetical protein
MNHRQKPLFSACLIALAALFSIAPIQGAWGQTAPDLGTASNFVVFGGAGVTCTDSTITGAVGSLLTVSPTATCTITGPIHEGDATAIAAGTAFLSAYDQLATANPCPTDAAHNLSGNLGGKTLSPGIYCISGTGLLTGPLPLTLDGGGNSNAVWIFKAASDLTPKGGSVVMARGGQACNVYWETGTAVDLLNTDFLGNILAGSAITFSGVGSSLIGRALAGTAVTATGADIVGCGGTLPPPPPTCDKDHKHHKHCKLTDHDKPHCDGNDDGHDNDGHDKDGHDKDGHDKDGHDKDGHG